jgi:hypothetical protein
MAKGQSWSMDLVIAVVIFGFMAIIFVSLMVIKDKPSIEDLKQSAQDINDKLQDPVGLCGPIIQGQNLTLAQLRCLSGQDYSTLKEQLGIRSDFCIYLEDSNGNLYIINNGTANLTGIGNSALTVSGTPCGQPTS